MKPLLELLLACGRILLAVFRVSQGALGGSGNDHQGKMVTR